jgi:uncharacterized protein with FMN-binding domain
MTLYEKHSRAKLTAIVVTVLVIAGLVVLADHLKSQTTASIAQTSPSSTTTTPTTPTTSADNSSTTVSSNGYKDGTYSATSDYPVPHNDETIEVSLTLKNGVVADASIKNSETDGTSAEFQEEFAADYKSYVVGKPVKSLKLGVIAGASDTTQGFNDAVSRIASQAQA